MRANLERLWLDMNSSTPGYTAQARSKIICVGYVWLEQIHPIDPGQLLT